MNWTNYKDMDAQELLNTGKFTYWSKQPDKDGKVLLLIHEDLFATMPAGLEVECINGRKVIYNPAANYPDAGYVDNDTRGGFIAYGIRVSDKALNDEVEAFIRILDIKDRR